MSVVKVFYLLLFALPLSASEHRTNEVMELLKAQQKRIPFKMAFTQVKKMKSLGLELLASGVLSVENLNKVTWELTKPQFLKVEMLKDEIKIYSSRESDPRVIKKQGAGDFPEASWIQLVVDDSAKLLEFFDVSLNGSKGLRFVPKVFPKPFDSMEMYFDQSKRLKRIFLQENAEDTLTIDFKG